MLLREEFNLIRVVLGGGVGIAFDLAHTAVYADIRTQPISNVSAGTESAQQY